MTVVVIIDIAVVVTDTVVDFVVCVMVNSTDGSTASAVTGNVIVMNNLFVMTRTMTVDCVCLYRVKSGNIRVCAVTGKKILL